MASAVLFASSNIIDRKTCYSKSTLDLDHPLEPILIATQVSIIRASALRKNGRHEMQIEAHAT